MDDSKGPFYFAVQGEKATSIFLESTFIPGKVWDRICSRKDTRTERRGCYDNS